MSARLHRAYMESFIGKEADVIIEQKKEGMLFGHSSEYIPVYIPWHQDEMPKRMRVHLKALYRDGMRANETEESS